MIPAGQLFAGAAAPSPENVEEFLMACHRRIEQRLDALERAAAAIEANREEALAVFESAFRFLDSSGALHTEDEEDSVFPRLRARMEAGERVYLAELEHDHAEAGGIYRHLRALVEGAAQGDADVAAIRGAVERLTALYRRHIASEDAALSGYARRLLTPEDRGAIAAEMRARRQLPDAISAPGDPESS